MNVLIVTELYPAYLNHSQREVNHAIHHFAREWTEEVNVTVIRPFLYPNIKKRDKRIKNGSLTLDGVTVHNIGIFKLFKSNAFKISSFYRLADEIHFKPDVIVSHLGYGLYFGFLLSKRLNVPLIAGIHWGDFLFTPKMLSEKLMSEIFTHAAGIACRSMVLKKKFGKKYPKLIKKSFEVPSGIPQNKIISEQRLRKKNEGKTGRKKISFITVSNLIKRKNIDINLRCLAGLDPGIQWTYKIIGDGEEKENLERLSHQLGLNRKVTFSGWIDHSEIDGELFDSDVFILLSVNETFGLAYLEAMAQGCVVICSGDTGIDGIIRDGENGFVCTPDIEDLSRAINILTEMDDSRYTGILENSFLTVKGLTSEKAAANYLDRIRFSLENFK